MDAIVEACSLLACGAADLVFAGGTEQLSKALAEGITEPGAQATGEASTWPGTPLSEGACLFVLERSGHAAARGARALATVTGQPRRAAGFSPRGESAQAKARGSDGVFARAEARGSLIVSVAGCRYPGAICIEHWIGRCLGACGAAAVAAAIAAAQQRAVPVIDPADPASMSQRQVPLDGVDTVDGALWAVVVAEADPPEQSHRSILELLITR